MYVYIKFLYICKIGKMKLENSCPLRDLCFPLSLLMSKYIILKLLINGAVYSAQKLEAHLYF